MEGDNVARVQLLRQTPNDGWTVDVDLGAGDRPSHSDSHQNEIVLDAERAFGIHKDDFRLRDAHGDEDGPDVTETDHVTVIDNTDDHPTLEESLEGTDILVSD
ncbi:hypothetical protein [Haloarchaeobius litoreus]|uniref:Uncharacterized protein n=1 Tax=Haloarchaeobius litoreus TaxID=755306 RepID=A0ABD6DK06_9EURY|nr:hypothetical protein [Haloarchaeobius litoreus]